MIYINITIICLGEPRLVKVRNHVEAELGKPLILSCKVCTGRSKDVNVKWEKDGIPVLESQDLRSYRRHKQEFVLRVQNMGVEFLGNYSCTLLHNGVESEHENLIVSQLPPPPTWEAEQDRRNPNEQTLRWTGFSRLPIINYILEFRLKPVSGSGEDWISLVVPFEVNSIFLLLLTNIKENKKT